MQLKKELEALETELNAYGDSNPAKIEELRRAVFLAKEATLRWTGVCVPAGYVSWTRLTAQTTTGCCWAILRDNTGLRLTKFVNTSESARIMRMCALIESNIC